VNSFEQIHQNLPRLLTRSFQYTFWEAFLLGTLQTEEHELREASQDFPYLGDFPPPAIVRVSREAGGVVRAAGCGGGADSVGGGDASVPAGLTQLQELEASPF